MSQNTKILNYLRKGHSLTPLEALSKFNCWALSSRIAELNAQGHQIKSELVAAKGKRFSQYSIAK